MTDKEKIKAMFNNKINKTTIYNNVLEKVEIGDSAMKNKIFKFTLAPICFILIICGVILLKPNTNVPHIIKVADNDKTEIYINKIKDVAMTSLDADVRLDVDIKVQEKFNEYPFVNDIKIPNDLHLSSKHLVYTRKPYETKEEIMNAPYDVLHDYVLLYEKVEDNVRTKDIVITFSKEFEPLRDYYIDTENLKVSRINNTELVIANYNDMYMTTFNYNNLNFDIETQGITQHEFITLLESITK